MDAQVKKFGDLSRIKLIAKEAGSAVAATTTSSQSELWDTLVNGCKDAVRRAGADSKVCKLTIPWAYFKTISIYLYVAYLYGRWGVSYWSLLRQFNGYSVGH